MKNGDTAPSEKFRKIFLDFKEKCVIIINEY